MVWSLVESSGHFDKSWLIHLQVQGPFDPEDEGTTTVLNVQPIYPPTGHCITEDLSLQQQHSENLKSQISILCSTGYVSTPVFTINIALSANPSKYS